MQVVFNDEMQPARQARIAAVEPGVLYGEGCFETIRWHHGRARFIEEHWTRLSDSAHALGLPLDLSRDQLLEHAAQLAHQNGVSEGVLRVSLHQSGEGADYLIQVTPPRQHPRPPSYRLGFSRWPHPGPSPLAAIKHNNYALFRAAHAEAQTAGWDEALLTNERDEVVEGAICNFFWVDADGQLCTPPLSAGALPGVVRAKVIALYPAILERPAARDAVQSAREIFLTNSLFEIMPVSALDGHALPDTPGEITRRVITSFRAAYPELQ